MPATQDAPVVLSDDFFTKPKLEKARNTLIVNYNGLPSRTAGFLIRLMSNPELTRKFFEMNAEPGELRLNPAMTELLLNTKDDEVSQVFNNQVDRLMDRRSATIRIANTVTAAGLLGAAAGGVATHMQYKKTEKLIKDPTISVDEAETSVQNTQLCAGTSIGALVMAFFAAAASADTDGYRHTVMCDEAHDVRTHSLSDTPDVHALFLRYMRAIAPAIDAKYEELQKSKGGRSL